MLERTWDVLLGEGITTVIFPGQQVACALEQTRLAICSLECWLVLDIDSIAPMSAYFQLSCSQNRMVSSRLMYVAGQQCCLLLLFGA